MWAVGPIIAIVTAKEAIIAIIVATSAKNVTARINIVTGGVKMNYK